MPSQEHHLSYFY